MSSKAVETVYGSMPANLTCAKLRDLCVESGIQTGPFGSQLHQEDYVEKGTPIITVEHLGENRIVHSNLPKVSDDDKARLNKYALKAGDIVFSRVGSVDRRALVQPAEDGWLFSGRCLRVRPNASELDAQWLSYFFGLPAFKAYIRSIAVGATMPSLNTKILSDVPIYFPDLATQRNAAFALAKLDDRITLLRETNATLEAIAQALFKSWFVDFDPVRAKRDGRAPDGMDEATAALFPDSFEGSELGAAPRGWRVCRVEDFADRVGMGPFGSNIKVETFVDSGIPVISGQHLKQFLVEDTTFNFITKDHAERLTKSCVQAGDVIFTHAGSIGQVALLHKHAAFSKYVLSQRQFFLRCRTELMTPEWIAHYFKTSAGQHQLLANTSQVGVPSIARPVSYLRSIQLVVPPPVLCSRFAEVCSSITDGVMANRKHITTLTNLRDALLPRLIPGQLRLSEVAEAIKEALA
ncbi:restriction endonuclease subunit S [Roseateles violae]|uniref:Restriction endonuclease subunit S n=1 Tax=Roseateles violae TaxID=3058042 RepID=A0ABT8DL16_9BURK|nr:restriction endonuclease subunit S [Pelomonas sp. PFR6]MDN3919106.1 restriction endonuclease subunit S [Pelomonas sp. PFR6]